MDKKEYEEIERKANELEHNASIKCNVEIQKAQNFYNGYQQGIEDILKILRRNLPYLEFKGKNTWHGTHFINGTRIGV